MENGNGIVAACLRGSRVLAWTGVLHAALAVLALVLMPFDSRTILGVDPWLKPFKFMASLAVYEWTLAWMLGQLVERSWPERVVAWGVALLMLGETACLWMQSARGTTSHFNTATPFDGAVFEAMGILIAFNTLLVAWLLILFLYRRTRLAPQPLLGVRLGLAVFLLGSIQGAALIANGAHAVGVPDGGPGLPLVNWSTEGGDLRIAHGLGLHGLQLFPLVGLLLERKRRSGAWLLLVLVVWLGLIAGAHLGAQGGRPLVPLAASGATP